MVKKLVQILTAAIISVGFIGSVASAQTVAPCTGTVTIHNSGNGNNTEVSCVNVKTITITCTNNVYVANVNLQDSESGNAEITGNGNTGSATTGSTINQNNTNTEIGASCGTVASPSVSPSVTPVVSVTPGKGAVTPTVLPYTAGNSTAEIVATSLVAAAGAVVVSRLALAAYRRFSVK
jgi:hypothetical protein